MYRYVFFIAFKIKGTFPLANLRDIFKPRSYAYLEDRLSALLTIDKHLRPQ